MKNMEGVTTRTSSKFVYELNRNKEQFARIRDKSAKFHSILLDCPNSVPYSTF